MTTTKRISVKAEPREQFTLDLVGKEYLVTAPKGALGLEFAKNMKTAEEDSVKMMDVLNNYILAIFGPRQAKDVQKRLVSATDDLDIPHIMDVVKQMVEEASEENPTT